MLTTKTIAASLVIVEKTEIQSKNSLEHSRPFLNEHSYYRDDLLKVRSRFLGSGKNLLLDELKNFFGRIPDLTFKKTVANRFIQIFFPRPFQDGVPMKLVQSHSVDRKNFVEHLLNSLRTHQLISVDQYQNLPCYLFEILEPAFFDEDKFVTFFHVWFEFSNQQLTPEQRIELGQSAGIARLKIYQIFAMNNPSLFNQKIFAQILKDLEKQYFESSINPQYLLAGMKREDLDIFTPDFLKMHFEDVNLRKNILLYDAPQGFPLVKKVLEAGYLPVVYRYDLLRSLHAYWEIQDEHLGQIDHIKFKSEFYRVYEVDISVYERYFQFWDNESTLRPLSSHVREGVKRFVNEYLATLNHKELLKQLSFVFQFYEYLFFESEARGSHYNLIYFIEMLLNHEVIFDVLSHEKGHRLSQAAVVDVLMNLLIQSNKSVSLSDRLRKIFKTQFLNLAKWIESKELPMRKEQRFEAELKDYSIEEKLTMIAEAKKTIHEPVSDRDYAPSAGVVSENPEDYVRAGYVPGQITYIYYPYIQQKYVLPEVSHIFLSWLKRKLKSKDKKKREQIKIFINEFPKKMEKYGIRLKSLLSLDTKERIFYREIKSEEYKIVKS